jgi:NAD(P)H-dependent FMN reductase
MENNLRLTIPVLLGSARVGRRSEAVAQFVLEQLRRHPQVGAELLDLAALDLPILRERTRQADAQPGGLRAFAAVVARADSLVVVSPEYKGAYPGVLKNALDSLDAWALGRKPVGIVTVSSGELGGVNCLVQLRHVCLSLGGLPIPDFLLVARVEEAFDARGAPTRPQFPARVGTFLDELIWYTEALARQRLARA